MIKFTNKKNKRIKVTSKKAKSISPAKLAKALGAELVTDPKEIAKLRKKYAGIGEVTKIYSATNEQVKAALCKNPLPKK